MKALSKKCLLHNAVILLIYVSFCALSKHFISLSTTFFALHNILILTLSAVYMYYDFNTNIFKLKLTFSNCIRQILIGLGAAILLFLCFVCIAALFEDVSLLPQLQEPLNIQGMIIFVSLQMIIALAEEAFFNYYLCDTLILLLRGNAVLSFIAACFCVPIDRIADPKKASQGKHLLYLFRYAFLL